MSLLKTIVRSKDSKLESEKYKQVAGVIMNEPIDPATLQELARWVYVSGVGLLQVTWDELNGKIVTKCLDPDEVYFKSKSIKLV